MNNDMIQPRFNIGDQVFCELEKKKGTVTAILHRDNSWKEKFMYEIEFDGRFRKYKKVDIGRTLCKIENSLPHQRIRK